ncbi:PilN domain-containing protein [Corallincola platygyrae]|uniref:PilN domain-containing protein n=1 Tax=Corallincola platygyrae TaxID=1193278 RepID=A0ABW4XM47_9GAMM
MAHINLLPWREEARKRRQNAFTAILGAAVLASVLLMYGVYSIIGGVIDGQRHRNAYLQQEIQVLDRQIAEIKELRKRKAELAQRMKLISDLQKNRNMVTRIFNELAASVPGGVYMTELDRKSGDIQITGRSESNNHLSNLMRRVVNSSWLTDPTLQSISADPKEPKLKSFSMRLRVKEAAPAADNQAKGAK